MATSTRSNEFDVYSDENQARGLYITDAHYDPATQTMHVALRAGMTISFAKNRSQVLSAARDEDLIEVDIGVGWSVLFPRLDDGFSLEGLLSGRFGNTRWEREWAQKQEQLAAA